MAISVLMIVGWILLLMVLYVFVIQPYHRKRKALKGELNTVLPGDDILQNPYVITTRAITIHAPSDQVWPWVVQIGKDRGGFYSYDWMENLAGLGIHSTDKIHPEFQEVKVGDRILFQEKGGVLVSDMEKDEYLVLAGNNETMRGKTMKLNHMKPEFTWSFVLCELSESASRLITRVRYIKPKGFYNRIMFEWIGLIAGMMERKMLRGIKERAEASQEEMKVNS